ncbi:MAG TPA: inositol monophosphatase family protein [Thermoplasmata archaeon]|jgi:fructose-1,6-bisphosphatase/inositol monophosphatase family enzyme|nr:inositol monophosphatase family protein [Thermoplasmata archaeon]
MKEVLVEAADAVTQAIASFGGDVGALTGTGAYGTPTQAIDKIAEDAVLQYLEYNGVDWNVLSEEAGFVARGGDRTLVLDPVDGTYNAVRGIPLYATSLAVGTETLSSVTHALVRDLPHGDTFYAEKGGGAFLNGKPLRTRSFQERDSLFSVYLGRMAEPEAYEVAKAARRVRTLGAASLDLCGVASGGFDLYYMKSKANARLRIMDIAAGVLLVREAGGVVVDPEGTELELPLTLEARTNLVAAGDRKALEALP